MQYRELKPYIQDSFGLDFQEPEDVVVPSKDTRQGIMYFQSYMPSFRQTGTPANVSKEKTFQRKGVTHTVVYNTLHFPGVYVDEYISYQTASGSGGNLVNPEWNKSLGAQAANLVLEVIPAPAGKAYMEANNLEPVKEYAVSFTKDAVEAHKELVNNCDWLSDASKKRLTDKMDQVTMEIVYPEVWEDYSGLDLDGLDYYEARRKIWLEDLSRNASYTGKEVDTRIWDDSTLIGGSGRYDSFSNSFFADAAFLKDITPYLAGELSMEELLGGLTGYVVFHELGHALDCGGIYRDARGEYVEQSLLEPEDLEKYLQKVYALENILTAYRSGKVSRSSDLLL